MIIKYNHHQRFKHIMILLLEKELNTKATIKYLDRQQGDVEQTFADITLAKTKYNYSPKFPLETGLKQFVNWYQSLNHFA